jgi:putative transposase
MFIPKCGRKTLYGDLRQYLGEVFRRLAQPKESRIDEGHLLPRPHIDRHPDEVRGGAGGGFITGKSAIHLARVYGERKRNFARAALLGARVLRVHGRSI